MSAQLFEYDQCGMSAESRCDRCGGQAWGEAVMKDGKLLFCAHHLSEHMPKLKETAITISDYTKYLRNQEVLLAKAK